MNAILTHLKDLHDQELHSNVIKVVHFNIYIFFLKRYFIFFFSVTWR